MSSSFSFWFPRQGRRAAKLIPCSFLRQVIYPVLSGETPFNWARLPPLTCTGVLHSLYPCTKGCTLCTPARTNWLRPVPSYVSSFGFSKQSTGLFCKKKNRRMIALRSIHRFLHLTLMVIFSCGRLQIVCKWINKNDQLCSWLSFMWNIKIIYSFGFSLYFFIKKYFTKKNILIKHSNERT